MRASIIGLVVSTAVAAVSLAAVIAGQSAPAVRTPAAKSVDARLRALEDKEAIHAVMMSYGRTLDARDFAGFADLFARDGEYVAGNQTAKGPAAIRALLESLLKVNAAPVSGRDFHLFYNETIEVNGDEAAALSKGGFYVRGAERQLQTTALVNYHDRFVREDGRWKFKRRQLGDGPPPASAAAPQ